jgi:hypothetical protein
MNRGIANVYIAAQRPAMDRWATGPAKELSTGAAVFIVASLLPMAATLN